MTTQTRRGFLAAIAVTIGATTLPVSVVEASGPAPDATADADLRAEGTAYTRGYREGWDIGERMAAERAVRINTPSAVVVGALYDFMGRLTTLDEPITVSRNHTVYALLDAFTSWAEDRGLDRNTADVEHWQERLVIGPAACPAGPA